MTLKKKPVTGMKDILPAEMQLRDYVTGLIKETYKSFGFSPIETPCVEHIENLCSKQGGDNEKLIFKIMKRGEKLNLEQAKEEADLTDSGLRYDLTVPLSRFYANNANDLPAPFKALQIGSVWRADRPQRGRFRQFVQCDIDILGEASCLAEIELILATTTLLGKLNFKDFKVRINERRILKAMAAYSGFTEDQYDQVFIILDKMDKIGWDGVKAELLEAGYPEKNVEIASSDLENRGFLFGGLGWYATLSFPHLNNIMQLGERVVVESAYLKIHPEPGTWSESNELPDSLYLYIVDRNNVVTDAVTDYLGEEVQRATFEEDNSIVGNNYYYFDVTEFMQEELGAFGQYKHSLRLVFDDETYTQTFRNLTICDQASRYPISLQLTFQVYESY